MRSCLMTRSSADGTLATRSGIRSRDTCSEPLRWRALKWSVTALRAIRSSQVRGDAREESYRSNDLKAFMKTSEVTSSAASRVATRKRMQRKTARWCSRNQVPKSSRSAKGAGAGATRGAGSDTLSSVCIALVYGDSATDLTTRATRVPPPSPFSGSITPSRRRPSRAGARRRSAQDPRRDSSNPTRCRTMRGLSPSGRT